MIRVASVALTAGMILAQPAFAQSGEGLAFVTIDFKGGTVEEYVALVEREFGGSANIVLEAGARLVLIGPVKLTVSQAESAAAAVEYLELDQTEWRLFTRGGPEFRVIGVEKAQPEDEEFRETHVWTFAELIEGNIRDEDALSAVENALDLTGGRADVRYHEDTQLLMVNGTNRQLEAVDQVISSLNGVTNWRENNEHDEAQAKVDKEAQDRIGQLEAGRDQMIKRTRGLELHIINLEGEIANLKRQIDK